MTKDLWTVFAKFPEFGIEEVDVEASSEQEARELGTDILNADYLPGWEIVDIVWRPAGTMFM